MRLARSVCLFAAAGTATLAVASCRQLADIEEHRPCEASGASTDSCARCRNEACCTAALACREDAACARLEGCLEQCPGEECRSACRYDHLQGILGKPFSELSSCEAAACAAECRSDGYLYVQPDCEPCARTSCGQELDACEKSAACLALSYCQQPFASQDHAGRGDCERRHPEGIAAARALAGCVSMSCAKECKLAAKAVPDWETCADQEPGSGPPLALTCQVKRIENLGVEGPFAVGATVRVCKADDGTCSSPLATAVADDEGKVVVEIPHGFDGYFAHEKGGVRPFIQYARWADLKSGTCTHNTFTPEVFSSTFAHLGVDDALGELYVHAVDCELRPGEGISFRLSPPSPEATAYYGGTGQLAQTFTDFGAAGGFVNLAPGSYTVSMFRRDTGDCVGKKQVWVWAGTSTQVEAGPSSCD